MSVAAVGVALEVGVLDRLEAEAQRRGVSRSRLVNEILSKTLPRIQGATFFEVQIIRLDDNGGAS